MKANHNNHLVPKHIQRTMVNIGMSKNESKSQLAGTYPNPSQYYGKYRHVKE